MLKQPSVTRVQLLGALTLFSGISSCLRQAGPA